MIDDIPRELREYAQWIVWRYEARENGLTKLPYDVNTGNLASVDDARTWATFDQSVAALSSNKFAGLGFVLTEHDPFCFIDLDIKGVISPDELERQITIQRTFNSYSETSPGGKGCHIICKGHVARGRRRSGIEIYSDARYMTVTGNIYGNVHTIEERQSLVDILWNEMQVGTSIYGSDHDAPQTTEDDQVLIRASHAANRAKFIDLFEGRWEKYYESAALAGQGPSEADFALIDMIAFYTQNREQIVRLFHRSELGKRKKAFRTDYLNAMVNRSFDRMLPAINFDSLQMRYDALKINGWQHSVEVAPLTLISSGSAGTVGYTNGSDATSYANATSQASQGIVELNDPGSLVKFPPGLIGDIASFIYTVSQRPVAEVSLAAAIGLMSGVCGRAYNTPTGAGLNLYTLLVALSGVGKEAMAGGISRLVESVASITPEKANCPSVREFIGPSEFRSDAALIKAVERQPSMVSIIGEFGLKLQQMHAQHANAHVASVKGIMLDLFGKSGAGNVFRPIAYSDQQRNTHEVQAPAFSILAESTPSTFYDAIDESMIAHGLLPRFFIIEYNGIRVPSNLMNNSQPSSQLMQQFGTLAAHAHTLMHSGRVVQVQYADEHTFNLANGFDKFCDSQINATANPTIRDLWNRGHLKVLKLASLVSVGLNAHSPLLVSDAWIWAQQLVEMDIRRMVKRFEKGDIGWSSGTNSNESKQEKELLRIMRDFMVRSWNEVGKYGHGTKEMQKAYCVPHGFINSRLRTMAAFRHDKRGATSAINATLRTLMESGIVRDVTGTMKFEGNTAKVYIIVDERHLTEEKLQ